MEVNFMFYLIYDVLEIFNLLIWNYELNVFSRRMEIFIVKCTLDVVSFSSYRKHLFIRHTSTREKKDQTVLSFWWQRTRQNSDRSRCHIRFLIRCVVEDRITDDEMGNTYDRSILNLIMVRKL
jgi:hypothetical protein